MMRWEEKHGGQSADMRNQNHQVPGRLFLQLHLPVRKLAMHLDGQLSGNNIYGHWPARPRPAREAPTRDRRRSRWGYREHAGDGVAAPRHRSPENAASEDP